MLTRSMQTGSPFNTLRREMDRLFDSMLETGGAPRLRSAPAPGAPATPGAPAHLAFPALNVWQDKTTVFAEAELPGVPLDNVEIYATADSLTIRARRELARPEKANVIRNERISGAFERTLTLPSEIDVDRVEAAMEHGVLTVTLPKAERVLPRRISVKGALPAGGDDR